MIFHWREWFPVAAQGMATTTPMPEPLPYCPRACDTCATTEGEMFFVPARRNSQTVLRRLCSTCMPVRFKKEAYARTSLV